MRAAAFRTMRSITAAKTLGGKSWEKLGRVWYAALTGLPSPNMRFCDICPPHTARGRRLYAADAAVYAAVDAGWKAVGD